MVETGAGLRAGQRLTGVVVLRVGQVAVGWVCSGAVWLGVAGAASGSVQLVAREAVWRGGWTAVG